MIKQIIAFLFTLFMVVSCVTPSQSFLAKKHKVYDRNVMVIEETKVVSPYSPYFETKELMEFTKNSITKENYDSIVNVFNNLKNNCNKKSNCIAYDVKYAFNEDTIQQRVYFIGQRLISVTHDNEIIEKMMLRITINLLKFQLTNNHSLSTQNTDETLFI